MAFSGLRGRTMLKAKDTTEAPELPSGWSWWSGNRNIDYYTRWFGTNYNMGGPLAGKHGLGGYEGQVYWDKPGEHHVEIFPITRIYENGDPDRGYPEARGSYDSEQEALDAVPELIESLRE